MFERFTDEARRVLFFARARTSERNGETITPEDLLGGIVVAVPNLVPRFTSEQVDALTCRETAENFMQRLFSDEATWVARAQKEIPFSATVKLAVERAVQEADDLGDNSVRPGHLLLGLLRDEETLAWRTLHEAGVRLREVRRILGEEGSGRRHGDEER
jgi:ATP-dependent Clp protease ATP-binding subunit ClpC